MVLVDTNVLLDVATRDPIWFAWSSAQLAPVIKAGDAAINPIIYSELAPGYGSEHELDSVLVPPGYFTKLALPYTAAFPAARAFAVYRQAGGIKTSPLPDFFIGAHAEVEGHTLLTRDPALSQTLSQREAHLPTVTITPLIIPPIRHRFAYSLLELQQGLGRLRAGFGWWFQHKSRQRYFRRVKWDQRCQLWCRTFRGRYRSRWCCRCQAKQRVCQHNPQCRYPLWSRR